MHGYGLFAQYIYIYIYIWPLYLNTCDVLHHFSLYGIHLHVHGLLHAAHAFQSLYICAHVYTYVYVHVYAYACRFSSRACSSVCCECARVCVCGMCICIKMCAYLYIYTLVCGHIYAWFTHTLYIHLYMSSFKRTSLSRFFRFATSTALLPTTAD